jgi:hypothetical protein
MKKFFLTTAIALGVISYANASYHVHVEAPGNCTYSVTFDGITQTVSQSLGTPDIMFDDVSTTSSPTTISITRAGGATINVVFSPGSIDLSEISPTYFDDCDGHPYEIRYNGDINGSNMNLEVHIMDN